MSLAIFKTIFQLGNFSMGFSRALHASGAAFSKPPSKWKSGMGKEDGQAISEKGAANENAYFKKLETDMLQRLRGGRKPEKLKSSSKKGDAKQ